jgi:hypothetical protein
MDDTLDDFELPILAEIGEQLYAAAGDRAFLPEGSGDQVYPGAATRGAESDSGNRKTRRTVRWRRVRHPRASIAALGALLLVTPALAASQLWHPLLGRPALSDVPGGTSDSTVAQRQTATLAVLRRPQTDDDRSPVVERLLAHLGSETSGVRTASTRLLDSTPGLEAVLVSVAAVRDLPEGSPQTDSLCLLFGHGATCGGTQQFLSGDLMAIAGSRQLGIVPDGVSQVVLRYADGTVRRAQVRANFFQTSDAPLAPPAGGVEGVPSAKVGARPTVTWLDSTGHVVAPLKAG